MTRDLNSIMPNVRIRKFMQMYINNRQTSQQWTGALAVILNVVLSVSIPNAVGAEPKFSLDVIDDDISIGYGLVIGEVNGDAQPDILLADQSEIVWYENPGRRGSDWTRHVMARNLTKRDNVCIAARDLDGDGLVEVAVGANWNPGNTSDTTVSGALFYLKRPGDPTKMWASTVISDHDPTTHRMHWMKRNGKFVLAVLPLHGRDNKGGEGKPVRVTAYLPSEDFSTWTTDVLDESMHMTHNFDLVQIADNEESLLVAGREGVKWIGNKNAKDGLRENSNQGAGEVRLVTPATLGKYVTIEPMHGTDVVIYEDDNKDGDAGQRRVLDATLAQGHALGVGNFLGTGRTQIVAGWRNRNADGKVGIRMYVELESGWKTYAIDDNITACEDLKVADLNGDDKPEIIASGRATKNVVVYWNEN